MPVIQIGLKLENVPYELPGNDPSWLHGLSVRSLFVLLINIQQCCLVVEVTSLCVDVDIHLSLLLLGSRGPFRTRLGGSHKPWC